MSEVDRYRFRSAGVSGRCERGETRVRRREESVDVSADLTGVGADRPVSARGQDARTVRAEGRAGQRLRVAVKVEEQLSVRHRPEACRGRPGGHDPAAVGAERRVRRRPEVTAEELGRLAGGDVPDPSVVVAARGDEELSVRAELDVGERVRVALEGAHERLRVRASQIRARPSLPAVAISRPSGLNEAAVNGPPRFSSRPGLERRRRSRS